MRKKNKDLFRLAFSINRFHLLYNNFAANLFKQFLPLNGIARIRKKGPRSAPLDRPQVAAWQAKYEA